MKKFQKSSLLIVLAMAFVLSACGTDDPDSNNNNNNNGNNDITDVGEDTSQGEDTSEGEDVDPGDDEDVDPGDDEDVDPGDDEDVDPGDDEDVDPGDDEDVDPGDDEDVDPGDSYPPNAADSALIEELLEDRDATPSFSGVLVTFTKPTFGNDRAGFFIQAEKQGPAAFVEVDPESFDPPIQAGNVVAFDVVALKAENQSFGRLEIAEIDNLEILGDYNDLPSFIQDINNVASANVLFVDYSLEIVSGEFTVTGPVRGGGTGFVSYPVTTEGLAAGENLVIRVPQALGDSLALREGCNVSLFGTPLWSHNRAPQVSAWSEFDLQLSECDMTVVTAQATSSTTVDITFSRAINPATLLADGSQFVSVGDDEDFVVGAVLSSEKVVTLTTKEQTADADYGLIIANTLGDTLGGALEGGASAEFKGFNDAVQAPTAAGQVVFTEVMARSQSGDDPGEYIEIYNPSATQSYDLNGCVLAKQIKTNNPIKEDITSSLVIAPGQYLVFAKESGQLGAKTEDAIFNLGGLGNNADNTLILSCNDVEINTYKYPSPTLGQSIQKSPSSDTWCVTPKEDDTYEYVTGKFGTPGEANFECPNP